MEKTNVLKDADPIYYKGNEVGILVSHGFTGTTQSMRPLAEAYARAGYTVCAPRLKGHGTTPEDMEKSTNQDWIESIDEGYRWLKDRCEVIFAVGLSMGGTLALYVVQNYPDIEGVIPINAAIDIPAMENTEAMDGPFIDAIGSDIKKEGVEELAYERTPVRAIDQLLDLMSQVKSQLASVHCPILVFVSDEDHVVPPHNSEVIFDTVFSEHKEIVHLENSYHVATLDNDQDLIIERSLEFFQMYTKTK